jgi:hypothetical protein
VKKEEVFFFEKKNQKTFATLIRVKPLATPTGEPKLQKFFGSFFQKRTASVGGL